MNQKLKPQLYFKLEIPNTTKQKITTNLNQKLNTIKKLCRETTHTQPLSNTNYLNHITLLSDEINAELNNLFNQGSLIQKLNLSEQEWKTINTPNNPENAN